MSINRRQLIHSLGAVALADLLRGGAPHFAPKAKRVIQIMCPGGVSHLDTFDYKPELEKRSGQPMPGGEKEVSFQGEREPHEEPVEVCAAGADGAVDDGDVAAFGRICR